MTNTTNPDELFSLWRERNQVISDTETETEEEPSYITPEETSPIMEVTEGTPLTQNMVEETPVIRTTPPIKTESLVKEITINKPPPFTGDQTCG